MYIRENIRLGKSISSEWFSWFCLFEILFRYQANQNNIFVYKQLFLIYFSESLHLLQLKLFRDKVSFVDVTPQT